MLHSVVSSMLPNIQALTFADKVGGIVYSMKKQVKNADGTFITKVFPVYNNDPTTCKDDNYIDMCPDSDLKSVVYFESTPETIVTGGCSTNLMTQSTLTLVAWFNLGKINKTLKSGESLLRILAAQIAGTFNIGSTHAIFTITNFNFRDPAIFSKYETTYREENKQYLIYPRDFGSITFDVQLNYGLCDAEPIIDPSC